MSVIDRQASVTQLRAAWEETRARLAALAQALQERGEEVPAWNEGDERFQSLFARSSVAILLTDRQGHFLQINRAACELLGVAGVEALQGANLFADSDLKPEHMQQLQAGGGLRFQTTVDFDAVQARGENATARRGVVSFDWSVSAFGDYGYLVQAQDISEQVATASALEASEVLLRDTFQAFPYPTLMWRHEGGVLRLYLYNEAADRIGQGRLGRFLNVSADDFYAHAPGFAERLYHTFESGNRQQAELPYRLRTTGQPMWIRTVSVKVAEDYVLDSLTDLTGMKRIEESLRQSEQAYRRIVETANEAIWTVGAAGRITFANRRMAEMMGEEVEALTGRSLLDLVAGEHRPQLAEWLRSQPEDPRNGLHVRLQRGDGSHVWVLASISTITGDDGEYGGALGMMADITDLMAIQEQHRAALAEKELLFKEIHHRVKNNLAMISGLLELQAAASEDANVQQQLRVSQRRIFSVGRLHETLYEAGEYGRVNMATYLRKLGKRVLDSMAAPGIEIHYRLESLYFSPSQAVYTGMIFSELVTNALKYAYPAGSGACGCIEVVLQAAGKGFCLRVRDDGVGLDQDVAPAERESLGVQVIASLTEQLQGEVSWRSAPGRGTEVTVQVADLDDAGGG